MNLVNEFKEKNGLLFGGSECLLELFHDKNRTKYIHAKNNFFPETKYTYIILKGLLKTYIADEKGDEKFLWLLGEGALLPSYDIRLTKRMYALKNTKLLYIEKNILVQKFHENPLLFEEFMEQIYSRYSEILKLYVNFNIESSVVRLCKLLYKIAIISEESQEKIRLEEYLTRQDMAFYVGTHAVNISKHLQRLEQEKIIKREGREITIVDIDRLRQKCEFNMR